MSINRGSKNIAKMKCVNTVTLSKSLRILEVWAAIQRSLTKLDNKQYSDNQLIFLL